MAQAVAQAAVLLARRVVRAELHTHPEHVAEAAQQAVNAVLLSARHIRVMVHPDDHALVAAGAAEALQARGARLLPHRRHRARRLPDRIRPGPDRRAHRTAAGHRPRPCSAASCPGTTTPAAAHELDATRAAARGHAPALAALPGRPAGLRRAAAAAGQQRHAGARHRPGARSRRRARAGGLDVRGACRRPTRRAGRSGGLQRRPRLPHAHRRTAGPDQRRTGGAAPAAARGAALRHREPPVAAQRGPRPAPADGRRPARPRRRRAWPAAGPAGPAAPHPHRADGAPRHQRDGPRPGAPAAGHRRARHQRAAHRRPRPAPRACSPAPAWARACCWA